MRSRPEKLSELKHALAAAIIFCTAIALIFDHLLLKTDTLSLGNHGDMRLNFLHLQWGVDWFYGNLPEGNRGFFNFPIFYPYQESLALSHNHLGSLPLSIFLNNFSDDWFTRGNLWLYSCIFLNAMAAYHATWLWLSSLGKDNGPVFSNQDRMLVGIMVGIAFSLTMTRIHYIEHPQTLPNFVTPYFFYFGFRAVRDRSFSKAGVAGLFFGWQALLDLHLTVMAYVLSLPLIAIYAIHRLKSDGVWTSIKRDLPLACVFLFAAIVIISPIISPYLQTQAIFGTRSLSDTHQYAPFETSLFSTSNNFLIYKTFLPVITGEQVLLPSLTFLIGLCGLIGWSFYKVFKRCDSSSKVQRMFYVLAVVLPVAFIFDFIIHRSPLQLFLHSLLPGVSSLRTPGRTSVYLMSVMVITIIWLLRNRPTLGAHWRTAFIVWCIWMISESATETVNNWEKTNVDELIQVFDQLDGPTIVLPFTINAYRELDLMQAAMNKKIELGNGYSGWVPHSFDHLYHNQYKIDPETLIRGLLTGPYSNVIIDRKLYLAQIETVDDKKPRTFSNRYDVFSRDNINSSVYGEIDWKDTRHYFKSVFNQIL